MCPALKATNTAHSTESYGGGAGVQLALRDFMLPTEHVAASLSARGRARLCAAAAALPRCDVEFPGVVERSACGPDWTTGHRAAAQLRRHATPRPRAAGLH